MAVYAAQVDRMDQGIGRILTSLEETGQLDNTVIFFLADNGASPEIPGRPGYDRNGATRDGRPALREAELQQPENRGKLGSEESYTGIGPAWANAVNTPLRYWKKESFEGGNRTPLIVHWPAGLTAEAGSIERSIGHVMDIAPTCLDLAGIESTGRFAMDGKSLKPLLQGQAREGHAAIFFEHEGGRGVRQGEWKLSALKGQPFELFRVSRDPGETNNLSDEHSDKVKEMAAAWQEWYDAMPVPESARIKTAKVSPPDEMRPQIANRPVTIRCKVTPRSKQGVILAQGGNQHGYALHFDRGKLIFSVRVGGEVESVTVSETPDSGAFQVTARLSSDATMALAIDGRTVAEGQAPGLIPKEPMDGLSIGEDSQSNVGEYREDEERFRGRVESVKVETGKPRT
jgi:arylsulfatase